MDVVGKGRAAGTTAIFEEQKMKLRDRRRKRLVRLRLFGFRSPNIQGDDTDEGKKGRGGRFFFFSLVSWNGFALGGGCAQCGGVQKPK